MKIKSRRRDQVEIDSDVEFVTSARRLLNVSQEKFAHAINVSVYTVSRWENGHLNPSQLSREKIKLLLLGSKRPIQD
jgi:DNA-binding transcriptional regulator YiaG